VYNQHVSLVRPEYLCLERGSLGTSPVRIDVERPSGLRMPSGNEIGANNNWIPGGRTSGDISEATVSQINPETYVSSPAIK